MNIAIVTSGILPVPATSGGAVENLIENIVNENENQKQNKITIYSIFDKKAKEKSIQYVNTDFVFLKSNIFSIILDNLIYYIAINILKKELNNKYRNITKRFLFIKKVSNHLSKQNFDKLVLENHTTLFISLKNKNFKKYKNKYYYHSHNSINSLYGCEKIISDSKKIMGVSNFICKQASYILPNIKKENFSVLYNCINTDIFGKKNLG